MKSKRPHDWPERLAAFIGAHRRAAFVWGVTDCSIFAANAVHAHTAGAVDIGSPFRGLYHDEAGALEALRRHAGGALPETMAKLATDFGLEPISWKWAQRGDLALLPDLGPDPRFGGALAIVDGVHAITMQLVGLRAFRVSRAVQCWRVW